MGVRTLNDGDANKLPKDGAQANRYGPDYYRPLPKRGQRMSTVQLSKTIRDPGLKKRHILFVEDDEVFSRNYVSLFEHSGFDVMAVSNPVHAVEALTRTAFDLVILDIALGNDVEAGFKLCRAIRGMNNVLPVIFFTNSDGEEEKIAGLRLGADDYLPKTESFKLLSVKISFLIDRIDTIKAILLDSVSHVEHLPSRLELHDLSVYWDGKLIELKNPAHFMIVHYLYAHRGSTCKFDDLMHAAHINMIGTLVKQIQIIRDAFKNVDPEFNSIVNDRTMGYRWFEPRLATVTSR